MGFLQVEKFEQRPNFESTFKFDGTIVTPISLSVTCLNVSNLKSIFTDFFFFYFFQFRESYSRKKAEFS